MLVVEWSQQSRVLQEMALALEIESSAYMDFSPYGQKAASQKTNSFCAWTTMICIMCKHVLL